MASNHYWSIWYVELNWSLKMFLTKVYPPILNFNLHLLNRLKFMKRVFSMSWNCKPGCFLSLSMQDLQPTTHCVRKAVQYHRFSICTFAGDFSREGSVVGKWRCISYVSWTCIFFTVQLFPVICSFLKLLTNKGQRTIENRFICCSFRIELQITWI